VHDETTPSFPHFFAMAGRGEKDREVTVKVINAAAEPVTAEVTIQGLGTGAEGRRLGEASLPQKLGPDAEVTVLSSGRPTDNNTMEDPKRIVPVTTHMRLGGAKFTREFAPYSFTLLKLKAASDSNL
jgi:alpha-L-arabinofuranosidase